MRAVLLSLVIVVAGCGGTTGGGDGGGGTGGGGPVDMRAGGPPDLTPRPIAGIACGANTCTTTLELCCTGDNGATGDCQKVQNPSCGASEFLCDGPEDCEPANDSRQNSWPSRRLFLSAPIRRTWPEGVQARKPIHQSKSPARARGADSRALPRS